MTTEDKLPDGDGATAFQWCVCGTCNNTTRCLPAERASTLEAERDAAIMRAEALERDADLLWANCRVIYFPKPDGSYPLEHTMQAWGGKDSREDIMAALRRDAALAQQPSGAA